nr:DUF1254 domain-containing protein [uncultured Sphingomonas sp.]
MNKSLALLLAAVTPASGGAQPMAPSYDQRLAAQHDPSTAEDTIPNDPAARQRNAQVIASEATIYGLPAVLQYAEMHAQALDRSSTRYTGFNRFAHDRTLAGPDYAAFKSPNSDTLYSNAWLDLTGGPVLIDVPPVPLRYYTLNFFDAYGNASNIGTRTFGSGGGRYLIAPVTWKGEVPAGATLFRVATPRMWVLMRIFAQKPAEVAVVRSLQDQVTVTSLRPPAPAEDVADTVPPLSAKGSGIEFLAILDKVLRTNGFPIEEAALIHRFRSIGVGLGKPFDPAALDPATKAGVEAGYADAMGIVHASRSQLGIATGTGWNRIEKGRYGFNYLNRATINYVGLGANVSEENYSFNTFSDGSGAPLDASRASYTLTLAPPPPTNAFWSLTLYDAATSRLFPNELGRYLVNDRTPDLIRAKDGSVTIVIQRSRPKGRTNWLPAPAGPFYLALRAYLPQPELLTGKWLPPPVIASPSDPKRGR